MAEQSVLEIRGLEKRFGPVPVLRGIDFDVRAGEVHALVGLNGSGKSTLVKILSGFHEADAGAVTVAGTRVPRGSHAVAHAAGLRVVHQDLGLAPGLDSVDNMALGTGYPRHPVGTIAWRRARRQAAATLARLGYDVDVTAPVATLTPAQRTGVAIARALGDLPGATTLVVLDEPTATLPGAEVRQLFDTIRRLTAEGAGVLYVSHTMSEIFEIADRVSVLRIGEIVATRATDGLSDDELVRLMVGRELVAREVAPRDDAPGPEHLTVRGLGTGRLRGLDLGCRIGEIVGVAGITGSGREEVAPALMGVIPRVGTISVGPRTIRRPSPRASVAGGIGYLPADRQTHALLSASDLRSNLTIADLSGVSVRGRLAHRRERAETRAWIDRLSIRPGVPDAPVAVFSGGNQQKAVLARWLRTTQTAIVLDEPTQGVDVESREVVYRYLRTASETRAVVVCSSDTAELARLCDRVIVLVDGRVAGQLHAPMESHDIDALTLRRSED